MPKTLSFAMTSAFLLLCTACVQTPSAPVEQTTSSSSSEAVMQQSSIYLEQSSTASDDGVVMNIHSSEGMMEASSAMMQRSSAAAGKAPVVRTIIIHAANFQFAPNVITAKQGEKVRLQIVGDEGIHGFAIPDLGINVRIEAGSSVTIDLPTDQAGHFAAFCSIPCGPGHQNMKATVVIQ